MCRPEAPNTIQAPANTPGPALEELVPAVEAFGAAPPLALRELAARAMTTLVPPHSLHGTVLSLACRAGTGGAVPPANRVHGRLLQMEALLPLALAVEQGHTAFVERMTQRLRFAGFAGWLVGAVEPQVPFANAREACRGVEIQRLSKHALSAHADQVRMPSLHVRRALVDEIVVPMRCPPLALPVLQSVVVLLPAAAESRQGLAPALGTACLQLLQR